MNLSFWERQTWFTQIDYAIIGSGIVGLSCALALREKHPKSKIVIFERGWLPSGASTKNAGFASYGSLSEIVEDLKNHSEESVFNLAKDRVEGLQLLRNNIGDKALDYQENGSYELFLLEDAALYDTVREKIDDVNQLLHPIFKADVFSEKVNLFDFKNIHPQLIFSQFEGQINTGKMMQSLIRKAISKDILILNGMEVTEISDSLNAVTMQLASDEEVKSKKVFIATNGFAKQFIAENIVPARAQVLITKPLPNLKLKGTFHFDKGYYYFRNFENRVLFGGGRNLDFQTEETTEMDLTEMIQNRLEHLLKTVIIPDQDFEIEQRWSGIMGVGRQKTPIVKPLSDNVFCGVRLGGIGIAIGSTIGKKLAAFA